MQKISNVCLTLQGKKVTLSPSNGISIKMTKYINMQIILISQVLPLGTSCLLLQRVCTGVHITLVYVEYWTRIGSLTISDVTNHAHGPVS